MLQLGFDQKDDTRPEWSYFRFQLLKGFPAFLGHHLYFYYVFMCWASSMFCKKKNYEKENSQGKTFQNSFNIEV